MAGLNDLGVRATELPADAVLIDVRRAGLIDRSPAVAQGARWLDPEQVDDWGAQLAERGVRKVVVYCAHGHEVSQSAAARLCELGIEARYLVGGLEAWKASGRPLEPIDQRPPTGDAS